MWHTLFGVMPLVGKFAPLLVTIRKHGLAVVTFRTAEIRIRLLHLNVGDFNLREVLCIHQHSALCQREGRARGQTFGAKASAPKKHETRQTHTRCCILCLHPKRDLRAQRERRRAWRIARASRTRPTGGLRRRRTCKRSSYLQTAWSTACLGTRREGQP